MRIRYLALALALACAATLTLSARVVLPPPDRTPGPTSTRRVPGGPRQWQASPVLVELYIGPGRYGRDTAWALSVPDLVVYADGRVIARRETREGDGRHMRVTEAQVSRDELCTLLATIEADGFFEFGTSEYQRPDVHDAVNVTVAVRGWRERTFVAYALYNYIGPHAYTHATPYPIPAGLANAYLRLLDYSPASAVPYVPEQVEVLISQRAAGSSAALWPFAAPSLANLFARSRMPDGSVMLEGEEARAVYALLGETRYWLAYREDGKDYTLYVRPILPFEDVNAGENWWAGAGAFASEPRVDFTCATTDNVWTPVPRVTPSPTPTRTPMPTAVPLPLERVAVLGGRDAPGQLLMASDFMITAHDEIVVEDQLNDRLIWFALDGTFLRNTTLPPEVNGFIGDMANGAGDTLLIATYPYSGTDRIIELDREGHAQRVLDGWPAPEGRKQESFQMRPRHLAQGPDGALYLSEGDSRRVVILEPDGRLREIWTGPASNPLGEVTALAVDASGNLYTGTSDPDRVLKRTPAGEVTSTLFRAPQQIIPLPDGSLYVMDYDGIMHLSATVDPLERLGGGCDWSWGDVDIGRASDGTLVMLQSDSSLERGNRLHRCSVDGTLLAEFGTNALLPGQFGSHRAFAVSPESDVWVLDAGDPFVTFTVPRHTRLLHYGADGENLGALDRPAGAGLDCDGYALAALPGASLLLADPCDGTVQRFDSAGNLLARWGARGRGPAEFDTIRAIVAAPDGQSVYVVDDGARRVSQFDLSGSLLHMWTAADLSVETPGGLAVDAAGTFYLLDGATRQVVVRPASGTPAAWSLPPAINTGWYNAIDCLAVDPARGWIYVGTLDGWLYVYSRDGALLGSRRIGGEHGTLVAAGADGHVYVSDGYDSIEVYAPAGKP